MRSSQTLVNEGNLANVLSGESHVLYAAAGLAVSGVTLIIWGWNASNENLLIIGLFVLLGAMGIAIDIWAHGYNH